ncbi:MAG: biotin/lipoyl-binding protein [Geobacteraceae bacterium]|nr:biotin/lipoyl-binding protein [Geobacteraceae bacterium]
MKKLRITLEGKAYEVTVELLEDTASPALQTPLRTPSPVQAPLTVAAAPAVKPVSSAPVAEGCAAVCCPMAGKVFKCLVKPGDSVTLNQVVIVLDAMKMETPVVASMAGTVKTVLVKEGDSVDEGDCLIQIEGPAH